MMLQQIPTSQQLALKCNFKRTNWHIKKILQITAASTRGQELTGTQTKTKTL